MQIHKVFNNNVILVLNDDGKEAVAIGKGIGFQKQVGDEIKVEAIERIFTQDNTTATNQLVTLLDEIPLEFFSLSEDVIKEAAVTLGKSISPATIINLTDHIYYSIQRVKEGIEVKNGLIWEIKRIYKAEYQIGKRTIEMINQKYNVELPNDEAGFIALHLVNGQLDQEMPVVMEITKFVNNVLDIIKNYYKIELDENSIHFSRLLTHLNFFASRVVGGEPYNDGEDQEMLNMVRRKYFQAYQCACQIEKFVEKEYKHYITTDEMVYLTIHLERVVSDIK